MTGFSEAIAVATFERMVVRQKVPCSTAHWFRDHLGEIDKAYKAGVPWSEIYELAEPELPEPLSFAAFMSNVFAQGG